MLGRPPRAVDLSAHNAASGSGRAVVEVARHSSSPAQSSSPRAVVPAAAGTGRRRHRPHRRRPGACTRPTRRRPTHPPAFLPTQAHRPRTARSTRAVHPARCRRGGVFHIFGGAVQLGVAGGQGAAMPTKHYADRGELGQRGEALACARLTAAGLRIVARNWRCRTGEIDVVAERSRAAGVLRGQDQTRRQLRDPRGTPSTSPSRPSSAGSPGPTCGHPAPSLQGPLTS